MKKFLIAAKRIWNLSKKSFPVSFMFSDKNPSQCSKRISGCGSLEWISAETSPVTLLAFFYFSASASAKVLPTRKDSVDLFSICCWVHTMLEKRTNPFNIRFWLISCGFVAICGFIFGCGYFVPLPILWWSGLECQTANCMQKQFFYIPSSYLE